MAMLAGFCVARTNAFVVIASGEVPHFGSLRLL